MSGDGDCHARKCGVNGEVHNRQSERINALKDLDQVRALAGTLADDVIKHTASEWDDVCRKAYEHATALLSPFIDATRIPIAIPHSQDPAQVRETYQRPGVQSDFYAKVQAGLREDGWTMSTFAAGASLAGAVVVGTVVSAAVFVPVAIIGVMGAGLFGMLRGLHVAAGRQLQEAKRELEIHLRTVMQRIQ